MCAKKKDDSEPSEEGDGLDEFVSQYTSAYRSYLAEKDMDERHLPQFYKGFPFVTEVYGLPNNAVCVLFRKSNRSKLRVIDGEYEDVKKKLDDRAFDFMQVFPPYTNFTIDEGERLARLDADRDLRVSRRLEILGATEVHMDEVHEEVDGLLELNPWLDEQTRVQKEKLDKAKRLILELYKEVEIDEDERFAEYSRSFMEIMAFEKGEIMEVAGEMEIQLETGFEEIEGRVEKIEQEIKGRMEKIEEDFETYGKAINKSVSGIEQSSKELKLQMDSLEVESGVDEEVDIALSKVRSSLKDTNKKIKIFERDVKAVRKELSVSQEIRDTVFRDSKRTHNLNERISDLESALKEQPKKGDLVTGSQLKALEGQLNIKMNDLKSEIKKNIKSEVKKEVPREVLKAITELEIEPPPPPDETMTPPKGATVKRTTKRKKTTKRKVTN